MSEIKVNKISPKQTCTQLTLGDSGDTIIIPAGATITNNGTATGFGATGAVNWDTTPKTSTFTAVNGIGYFVNTTSGAITVNLPAGTAGAIISLADYTNTWQTNNVTVTPNGSEKIGGIAGPATLNTEGQSVTFIYVDATEGWKNVQDSTSNVTGNPFIVATGGTITTSGNFKTHVFTGPGTFTVTNAGSPSGSSTVDYLVVAGGGGAGRYNGGGGGGGGLRTCTSFSVSTTAYPITVGGGGAASPGPGSSPNIGSQGSPSTFNLITSTGGGYGGGSSTAGGSGGSGGGGGCAAAGGSGNTPPTSPSQGNNGGTGGGPPIYGGAGGGGAGAVGNNGTPTTGGSGGAGSNVTPIFGPGLPNSGVYAGGGGGAVDAPGTAGTGGTGGGGAGVTNTPGTQTSTPGTVNTGGGGGAAHLGISGSGGSGIVVIRYQFQ